MIGLAVANGLSFVVGAVVGQIWLHVRLGRLATGEILITFAKTAAASIVGGAAGAAVAVLIRTGPLAELGTVAGSWVVAVVGAIVGTVLILAAMRLLRLREIDPMWRKLLSRPR